MHVPKFCNLNQRQQITLFFYKPTSSYKKNTHTHKEDQKKSSYLTIFSQKKPAPFLNNTQSNNIHVLKTKERKKKNLHRSSTDTLTLAACTGLDSHHARIILIRQTRHPIKYINKAFTGTLKCEDDSRHGRLRIIYLSLCNNGTKLVWRSRTRRKKHNMCPRRANAKGWEPVPAQELEEIFCWQKWKKKPSGRRN